MEAKDLVKEHDPSLVTIAELATRWDTNIPGAVKMCKWRHIPINNRDGVAYVRADDVPADIVKIRAKGTHHHPSVVNVDKARSDDAPCAVESGESRTVKLRSGGSVQLTVNVSVLHLSPDDRAWLFGLVDQITGYVQADQ